MIPVQIQPLTPNAAQALPSIGNAANISGNAPQVPPAFASLPPGTIFQGFVLNRPHGGEATLRTNLGDFLIKSEAFLKIGSEVSIRVRATGSHFRADIIEVDGKPVSTEQQTNQRAGGQHLQASSDEASRIAGWQARRDTILRSDALPNLDANGNVKGDFKLSAVLLSPNDNAASQRLGTGTSLLLNLLNLKLPNAPASSAPTPVAFSNSGGNAPPSAQAANPVSAAASANAPTSTSTTPTAQAASSGYQHYQQAQPSTTNASNTASLASTATSSISSLSTQSAQTLPGQPHTLTVIGQEKDGGATVQTPFGLAKITSHTKLPTGSVLQAQIALDLKVPNNPLVSQADQGATSPSSLFRLAHDWPAMQQIIQLLGGRQSDEQASLLPIAALPQLSVGSNAAVTLQPAQFSSGAFLFFAALRGGDFRSFLGEKNIQKLTQSGHSLLLNQASADFAQLARLAGDGSGQWQSTFFPVLVNGEVEMVRWFNKRDGKSSKDEKKETSSTRFIVEMSTSVLGELQLDGLYHYQTERNRLELVLRSHSPLDEEIRQGIMQIVQEVNDTTGVLSSVSFQSIAQFPEYPLEDALRDIPDVMA